MYIIVKNESHKLFLPTVKAKHYAVNELPSFFDLRKH